MSNKSRRDFIKKTSIIAGGMSFGFAPGLSAKSYRKVLGSNDRISVGIVGFSNRAKNSLIPSFLKFKDKLNFELIGVSDIWNRRREEGSSFIQSKTSSKIYKWRNNEEMYEKNEIDAVIISTADFQHALHTVQATEALKDVYVEKPFAETMEDARIGIESVKKSKIVFQIGSQRRSANNYHAANNYIKSGKFGDIVMVEMKWNVNQPDRWRLPKLIKEINKKDTDWKRYLMNRPYEPWNPRKYLEYRLFWPYSSGIPGQWMSHQIDTVHWFSGFKHPRSVVANGDIYLWNDGRENFDTMTAVFDYGDSKNKGFQVIYSSRFTNSAGGIKEIYYSNSGELNLKTNKVTPNGGLKAYHANKMGLEENLLNEFDLDKENTKVVTSANTGVDDMTSLHVYNWMECVRNRKTTNGTIEAAYNHSIANIMTTAALRTGLKATFDEGSQNVLVGGKIFKY
ncbi:MAG: Gfo/Idh/MocA family oxidoreductase [Flavobacteriaceae bacterium]|nr:Gfo/Idh/MocA family oxidoreductase [Flavobacteriaceae bacterium]